MIPAVIVAKGKDSVPTSLNPKLLGKVWQDEKRNRRFTLKLGEEELPALLKDVQVHALKRTPLHADIMLESGKHTPGD